MNKWLAVKEIDLQKNSANLIFLVLLLLIFIMVVRTPVDTDLWWHLRLGETIAKSGHPILIDQFSFTKLGAAWTDHEWVAEIFLYVLYHIGGFLAIATAMSVVATTSFAMVYIQMSEPALLRAFVIILAGLVAAPVWVPRPELLSLLCLAIVGYLLYLYKWKQKDRLWLLIPLYILWCNLHGGYVLGIMLMLVTIAGELLNFFLGFKGSEILPLRKIARLAGWTIVAILAVLINPNGIQIWLIPFQTVGINALQNYIAEWASPDFHQFFQQPFIWMLLLTISAIGLSMRRVDGTDLCVLAVFCYLGLDARRNFGPFAIVCAPILCRYGWASIVEWKKRIQPALVRIKSRFSFAGKITEPGNQGKVTQKTNLINFSIVAILMMVAIVKLVVVTSPADVDQFVRSNTPQAAVNWIEANQPEGRLFNSYNWGGYILWNLRNYPVFVDGRTDLYTDEIIGQWLKVVNANPGWQAVLDQWDIHLILLEPSWPIVKVLPYEGWHILYQDNIAVVFGR